MRDEVRGGIRGAKKIGGLMQLAARYDTEPKIKQLIDQAIKLEGLTRHAGKHAAARQAVAQHAIDGRRQAHAQIGRAHV